MTIAPEASPNERRPEAAYAVKLPVFEGPLDLLLHLIRQNDVDVTDIPIALIAEQYLEALGLMQELDLDVAGEYLLMAATLAWIKSRMLLPSAETEEDEGEIDPRAELVARLLEYQRFKEAAEALGDRHRLERDVFAAWPGERERSPEQEREIEVGLVELLDAFRRVVRAAQAAMAVHEVEVETITVQERMFAVMEQIGHAGSLEFDQLFATALQERPSRAMLVATFLALLELVRLCAIRVYQGRDAGGVPCGPLHLRRVEGSVETWREWTPEST